MADVFLGLGANLGDRGATLRRALEVLAAHPRLRLRARSRLRRTAPVGGPPQPDYANAVARLETSLSPWELLRWCQRVEGRFHRRRTGRDHPRTLDLDLLLYGDWSCSEPELTVPHPRMFERPFVTAPLAEIAPRLVRS